MKPFRAHSAPHATELGGLDTPPCLIGPYGEWFPFNFLHDTSSAATPCQHGLMNVLWAGVEDAAGVQRIFPQADGARSAVSISMCCDSNESRTSSAYTPDLGASWVYYRYPMVFYPPVCLSHNNSTAEIKATLCSPVLPHHYDASALPALVLTTILTSTAEQPLNIHLWYGFPLPYGLCSGTRVEISIGHVRPQRFHEISQSTTAVWAPLEPGVVPNAFVLSAPESARWTWGVALSAPEKSQMIFHALPPDAWNAFFEHGTLKEKPLSTAGRSMHTEELAGIVAHVVYSINPKTAVQAYVVNAASEADLHTPSQRAPRVTRHASVYTVLSVGLKHAGYFSEAAQSWVTAIRDLGLPEPILTNLHDENARLFGEQLRILHGKIRLDVDPYWLERIFPLLLFFPRYHHEAVESGLAQCANSSEKRLSAWRCGAAGVIAAAQHIIATGNTYHAAAYVSFLETLSKPYAVANTETLQQILEPFRLDTPGRVLAYGALAGLATLTCQSMSLLYRVRRITARAKVHEETAKTWATLWARYAVEALALSRDFPNRLTEQVHEESNSLGLLDPLEAVHYADAVNLPILFPSQVIPPLRELMRRVNQSATESLMRQRTQREPTHRDRATCDSMFTEGAEDTQALSPTPNSLGVLQGSVGSWMHVFRALGVHYSPLEEGGLRLRAQLPPVFRGNAFRCFNSLCFGGLTYRKQDQTLDIVVSWDSPLRLRRIILTDLPWKSVETCQTAVNGQEIKCHTAPAAYPFSAALLLEWPKPIEGVERLGLRLKGAPHPR